MSDKVAAALHGGFTCAASEQVLPDNVDRQLWLAARREGFGGSDISGILALSRWNTPRDVWADKMGGPERPATWPMLKGTAMEPALIKWFEQVKGIPTLKVGMQRNMVRPWMLYTPDALSADGGIVEGKDTSWYLREEWDDEQVSDHAELQVQWGMAVTGRTHGWVVASVGDDEPVIRRVSRDDTLIETLITAVDLFRTAYVLTGIEPPPTGIDIPELRKRYANVTREIALGDEKQDALIQSHQDAAKWIKHYTAVQKDADAQLLDHFKDADHLVIDGEIAATWKKQTARRLSQDLLVEDGIDIEQYKTESSSRVLRIPAKRKPLKGN